MEALPFFFEVLMMLESLCAFSQSFPPLVPDSHSDRQDAALLHHQDRGSRG